MWRILSVVTAFSLVAWAQGLRIGDAALPNSELGQSLIGRVMGPTGNAVRYARVKAVRLTPTRWTSGSSRTRADGTFEIPVVGEGSYLVCVQVSAEQVLADPCTWLGSETRNLVDVKGAGRVSAGTIVLVRGRRIEVVLMDPGRYLTDSPAPPLANGRKNVRDISMSIHGPLHSTPLALRATRVTSEGTLYEAIIPESGAAKLVVHGFGISLSDEAQRPLANNRYDGELPAPASKEPVRRTFHVNGVGN